jgi:hypothetical protein
VLIQKRPICPISALREKFDAQNINHMPVEDPEPLIGAVKLSIRGRTKIISHDLDGRFIIKKGGIWG